LQAKFKTQAALKDAEGTQWKNKETDCLFHFSTELWATWSSGRCPCSWEGTWNQMFFNIPSNPYHSMILRFYENGMMQKLKAKDTEIYKP